MHNVGIDLHKRFGEQDRADTLPTHGAAAESGRRDGKLCAAVNGSCVGVVRT